MNIILRKHWNILNLKQNTQIEDLTNRKFGRWTVLSLDSYRRDSKNRRQGYFWNCRCECGIEKIIRAASLKNGTSRSCGCLLKDVQRQRLQLPKGVAAFNALYSKYKSRATERGLLFKLNREQFRILTQQPCFYCNDSPKHIMKAKASHFRYNGIDRVDSSIGYLENNVVPCCGLCNRMKMKLHRNDFIEQILKIALVHGV